MAAAMRSAFWRHLTLYSPKSNEILASRLTPCVFVNKKHMSMTSEELAHSAKGEKISHAMRLYIERLRKHEKFVEDSTAEYELGKRHLANIMGEDPDCFTQEDIDKAIQYLLPSGLFSKEARPQMKHPDIFIPKTFVAQFDVHGRPLHSMYYTCKPAFYKVMFDAAQVLEKLKKVDDEINRQGLPKAPELFLADSSWMTKAAIGKHIEETIQDEDYEKLMRLLKRIIQEPQASSEKTFIMRFREKLGRQHLLEDEDLSVKMSEDGRLFAEAEGSRKSSRARVKLYSPGKGKVTINGEDFIDFFPRMMDRHQILFPLHFVDKIGSMDIEAEVSGGGPSGQAGALRYAVSLALQSFVDKETRTKMRLAGLLTRDVRTKERKKFGQARARKKFTWKKR